MKHILFFFILLFSQTIYSQNRNLKVENYQSPDSSFWYAWRMKLCGQIGLDSIQNSAYKIHFRLWTNRQAVDIWESSDSIKFGKITSWTTEYSSEYDFNNPRVHFNSYALDSSAVLTLFELIDSSSILNVPDGDAIENWGRGFDGITYVIETAINENYFFKSYWTPEVQDSLNEAILVQSFVNESLRKTNADNVWKEFVSTIPFECYINESPMVTCRFLTRKEKRKLRRENKRYR